MNKREFLETWFRRVWQDEDLDAINEMMADQAPVTGLSTAPQMGAADFRAFAETLLKLIKDTEVTIEEYMECGDQVSVLMNISAKCRKTGKPVQTHGLAMARVVDGKFTQAHNYVDFISMFEQLGQLPAGTMGRCLSGETVA